MINVGIIISARLADNPREWLEERLDCAAGALRNAVLVLVQVVAEEEQHFLSRQQLFLQQGGAINPPGSIPAGVQKTPDRKVVGSPGIQGSPKKVEKSAPSSDRRIASCLIGQTDG